MARRRALILSKLILLAHESRFVLECLYLIWATLITDLGRFLIFAHQHQGWLPNVMGLHVSDLNTSDWWLFSLKATIVERANICWV